MANPLERPKEIQRIYLSVQQNIGQLMTVANPEASRLLRQASTAMLRAKREMIGDVDELSGAIPLAVE